MIFFIDAQDWITIISMMIAFIGILLSLYVSLRSEPIHTKIKVTYFQREEKSKILVINTGNSNFLIHAVGVKLDDKYFIVPEIVLSKRYRLPVYDQNNKVIMTNKSKYKMVSEPGDVVTIDTNNIQLEQLLAQNAKLFIVINSKIKYLKKANIQKDFTFENKNNKAIADKCLESLLQMSKSEAKYYI
ncbi:MAG: hypothetical protein AB7E23_01860 [Bacilli bacterium]|jgi:hypothetical protein